MNDFFRKNKINLVILAVLLVFTVLLCIPATIKVFAGVFGYAAYFYLALGYAALILRWKKIKLNVSKKDLALYVLTGIFILLTLHVGIIGKAIAESGFGGYIGSTYEKATVGGVVLSVVSSPIVLLCKYIASVVIFFVLAATGGFLCISPVLFGKSEKRAKKKKKAEKPVEKAESFAPPVLEDEAPAAVDSPIAEEKEEEPAVGSREYAYKALFGTAMPKDKESHPYAPAPDPAPAPEKKAPRTYEEKKAELFGTPEPTDRYRITEDVYATLVKPDDSVYTNNYLADQRRKEARDKLFGVPPSESARVDYVADKTIRNEVEEGIKYTPYVPSTPLYDSEEKETYVEPEETELEPVYSVPQPEETPSPYSAYKEAVEEPPYVEPTAEEDELPTVADSEYLRALNAEAGVDAPRALYSEEEEPLAEDGESANLYEAPAPEPESEPVVPLTERFSPIRPPKIEPEPEPTPEPETVKEEPKPAKKKRARKKYVTFPEEMLIDRPLPPGYLPYVENLGQLKDVIENQSQTLGLSMTLIDAIKGPTVTFCTVALGAGCQVKKVTSVQQDLALMLHAKGDINIVKQIPGTPYIGIEIPNNVVGSVSLKEILTSDDYKNAKGDLVIALGKYSRGEIMVSDLADWPHGLIAGSSGSGKSVCLNGILVSLIYRYSPFDLQLILVDMKKVEMMSYNGLPHMLFKKSLNSDEEVCKGITWLQKETERRFDVLMEAKAKNLNIYNSKMPESEQLPRILLVIDEASELMTRPNLNKIVGPALSSISRIGRACGVHMIFATQTPSRDVITSEIQNNFNTKIAFRVGEFGHSMVILKQPGAEKLLGKGDMLYRTNKGETLRGQGLFVSDQEIDSMVEYIIQNNEPEFDEEFIDSVLHADKTDAPDLPSSPDMGSVPQKAAFAEKKSPETDEAFLDFAKQVMKIFVDSNRVSATYIQRKFSKGYNTIANVMDYLEDKGYVSPQSGNKRNLLITKEEFYALYPEMRDADPDDFDGE